MRLVQLIRVVAHWSGKQSKHGLFIILLCRMKKQNCWFFIFVLGMLMVHLGCMGMENQNKNRKW